MEPPGKYPRATEEIPMMVEIIETLIARGHAYEADGNVYFRVASDPDYGRLSRLPPDEMAGLPPRRAILPTTRARSRRSTSCSGRRRSPASRPGPALGPGRPGWHIECSAMSMRYLGETLDIHGGGGDLVYPHHESEIAQSECWTRRAAVRALLDARGMLRMDGEKMSKSLGNMVFVHDLLKKYRPEAIRLYLSGVRYRDVLEWDPRRVDGREELVTLLRRPPG